jgi:hypothetical protein
MFSHLEQESDWSSFRRGAQPTQVRATYRNRGAVWLVGDGPHDGVRTR